ncbi:TetR/AcrR family transcriptional regulator [Streptomyces sp. WP-1]|uniref:TetR/AcrR family transcriptional regulator n=1 Tax=Streptomyces sp. WP-1 TaxID=3041497 RepID=UPI00264759DB|nr:TetR/AcrR family transcriptional regulator [Streptomyces sp. WP-1]WKE70313.1 TetR/AcrR family transcriptional regulator [Streptomyces sp. WP-1]
MGGGRTRRMPRAERERQMLDAAVEIIARHGYTAASMDEIAELAGVSKPLVYLYLNSKDDLFTACIRREAAALTEAVRAAVRPALPADRRLWDGVRAFFTYTAEHPDGWTVLHLQARTHGPRFAAEADALRAEMTAFVTRLIATAAQESPHSRDLPAREIEGLAAALVGAAESLADWTNTTPTATATQASTTLMNFAWTGLGNLLSGNRWAPPGVASPTAARQ